MPMLRPIIKLLAVIGLLGMVVRLAPSGAHMSNQCPSPIAAVEISTAAN